jgi:ABC-type antimicrobial peptide transport system permease subunit
MKIPLLSGRDFRGNDADPQVAIVNLKFAQQYFGGANPVGQRFKTTGSKTDYEIVGLVGDAAYHQIRDPMMPVVYTPFQSLDQAGAPKAIGGGTVLVRAANPAALEPVLRREIHGVRSAFRVSNVRTQQELIDAQTVRERLLVMLGVFFAGVALLLAGIGLYGVVNYSVQQRRREIGIRLAVGARGGVVARLVAGRVFSMVVVGLVAGLGLGLASARYMESLFFQVKASDASLLVAPSTVILAVAVLATVPGVLRALRIDPAEILRAE